MCGFVGYWSPRSGCSEKTVRAMAQKIAHRGPDDQGVWQDREAGFAMAFRRLAIVDLTQAGSQPMTSVNGQLVLAFNGEIYNHKDLRADLEAAGWRTRWRGHSDTETLLAAFQVWGIDATLQKTNGMFAVALWNKQTKELILARDRAGEKPLYYGYVAGTFFFASELKAFYAHPAWQGNINRNVLASYLRHAYVPDPYCIFEGFHKLAPAHWVKITNGHAGSQHCYWSLARHATVSKRRGSDNELIGELEARLRRAVALRMEADVPLGAFLSGGIDSSAIAALMQAQSARAIKTFTIGFDVQGYNEAEQAANVAKHLGADHSELYLTSEATLATVSELPQIWDEPFADSSQIPTLLLSRMAREKVTVALSGDGGDELFAGYNRYASGYDISARLRKLPTPFRRLLAYGLKAAPAHMIDKLVRTLPSGKRFPAIGDKLVKLGRLLELSEGSAFYSAVTSQFQHPERLVLGSVEASTIISRINDWPQLADFRETMMYLDAMTYLPGDILTKVDRATMAVSLEGRMPFLDHTIMEYAWSLPLRLKLRDGVTKWALRQVLHKYVPQSIVDRPKMGFGVPIEHWLSGPLRNWAEDLLSPKTISADGLLDVDAVRNMWADQLSRRGRWHHQLWTILMFIAWSQCNRTAVN